MNIKKKSLKNIKKIQGKFNHTYLNGLYLVINAIPGAYLLMDSPPCGYDKVSSIEKTHDLFSDLFRENSKHRICCTDIHIDCCDVVNDRSDKILTGLFRLSRERDCSVIFLASMPVVAVTGISYAPLLNEFRKESQKPVVEVPFKSLKGDWLDGYEEALCALVGQLQLKKTAKKLNSVAIVGYLFDRNEGDHVANIGELNRILSALGIECVTTWLDGSSVRELRRIESAQKIISLPYARRAAKAIAQITGAELIEADMPLGIHSTKEWINKIAISFHKERRARIFIDEELKNVIPVVKLVSSICLLEKTITIFNDPVLAVHLAKAFQELGLRVDELVIFGKQNFMKNLVCSSASNMLLLFEPSYKDVYDLDISHADFLIGNSHIHNLMKTKNSSVPFMEIGYPSFYYHALTMQPFLGFKGFLCLLNRMINHLQ
jgi:nitrogenase molybdenum-iron protein alpha/beta subunit